MAGAAGGVEGGGGRWGKGVGAGADASFVLAFPCRRCVSHREEVCTHAGDRTLGELKVRPCSSGRMAPPLYSLQAQMRWTGHVQCVSTLIDPLFHCRKRALLHHLTMRVQLAGAPRLRVAPLVLSIRVPASAHGVLSVNGALAHSQRSGNGPFDISFEASCVMEPTCWGLG